MEQHYASGNAEPAAPASGKRVAVIGSGPSGLSAAQRLADQGHTVTVYEKADRIGGLLEYGIPNMKLEKGLLDRKVNSMKEQSVQFVAGVNVNASNAAEITAQYDAVVLAVGAGNARSLNLADSEGVKGIIPAVDFLTDATKASLGHRVDGAASHREATGNNNLTEFFAHYTPEQLELKYEAYGFINQADDELLLADLLAQSLGLAGQMGF